MEIPVYMFTGFLEAGKTKFIQESMEDIRFNSGERTLLLVCEEGEEEYDMSSFSAHNVYLEVLDDPENVTTEELDRLVKKHNAERVVVEMNGMCLISDFFEKMPEEWTVYQEMMFADARTIISYNANMRQLVYDKLVGCELVVFNRVPVGTDTMPLHQLARAANRKTEIIYEYDDGSMAYDEIEDPLPFDIEAPVIVIEDKDYALWYRDLVENSKKYVGKTVRFKAQVGHTQRRNDEYFIPGRFVMTCCAADISFMGVLCKWKDNVKYEQKSWVTVEATIAVKFHILYKGTGPILTAKSVTPAERAEEEVATF